MTREELILIAHSARGVGQATLTSLLHGMTTRGMEPDDLLSLSYRDLQDLFGFTTHVAGGLAHALTRRREASRRLLEDLQRTGVTMVTCLDAAYPQSLAAMMADAPPVLYVRGDMNLLSSNLICLANSRDCPKNLAHLAEQALSIAVETGFRPVTGHNRPEYQLAALVARRYAVPTCYVLDRGILSVDKHSETLAPFRAARIWRSNPESPDLVVSPFAPSASYVPGSNRYRDRVILGLAKRVLSTYLRPDGNMLRHLKEAALSDKPIAWLDTREALPSALCEEKCLSSFPPGDSESLRSWLLGA